MSLLKRSNGNYASIKTRKPLARSKDLVIEELEHEVLVYDSDNRRAHCLGATAGRVWRACDGQTDAEGLALLLDLSPDEVDRALEELEAAKLLDSPELEVVNGNGNGNGITRRDFGSRSVKAGAAVAAAPMIYSVVVASPAMAATPSIHLCNLFTTNDCGSSKGCASIPGCCCCCRGTDSCKTCSSINACENPGKPNFGGSACAPANGGGVNAHGCSSMGGSGTPPNNRGCCGVDGALICGCGFSSATQIQIGSFPALAGQFGNGPGCCDTSKPDPSHPGLFLSCSPSSTNGTCVPCCSGSPIGQSAQLGCCDPTQNTTTCPTT